MNKTTSGTLVLFTCGLLLLANGLWIPAKAILAQHLLQNSWDKSLTNARAVKPWPWADTWPVARLQVPAHKVDIIVLAGTNGEALAFGPGHLEESSTPGSRGNCVFAGHRDTSFNFLRDIKPGEKLIIQGVDGKYHSYQVTATAIREADKINLEKSDESWLTLITCYPFTTITPGGPLRFLVFARMV